MLKKEAEKLIGARVSVWTAANGVYVGILEKVFANPWRGSVRITGIVECAQHYERGGVCRRGFRVGEIVEAGGSSIRPTDENGSDDYLSACEAAIAHHEASLQKHPESRHAWVHREFAKALRTVIQAERRRLEAGVWSFKGIGEGHV